MAALETLHLGVMSTLDAPIGVLAWALFALPMWMLIAYIGRHEQDFEMWSARLTVMLTVIASWGGKLLDQEVPGFHLWVLLPGLAALVVAKPLLSFRLPQALMLGVLTPVLMFAAMFISLVAKGWMMSKAMEHP